MILSESKIRVRYADTDQMKMVYYAKYFEYFEQSRSDLLRGIGLPYPQIEAMGFYLPVIEAHARYLRPARYDDLLTVKTVMKEMPLARVHIEYELRLDPTGDLLAEGYTSHSFVSAATGRASRAPEQFLLAMRQAFEKTSTYITVKE